jgi:diaminopropionate ammonia-lyase
LMRHPQLAQEVGLDQHSTVLVINTEGATAPAVYQELVGESAEGVLTRQRAFLERRARGGD